MVKFSDYQRLKDAALLDRSEAKVVTIALSFRISTSFVSGGCLKQGGVPTDLRDSAYRYCRKSRINLCSFSSLIRVNSLVPSLLIVSGRSKGNLSYTFPP